MGERVRGWANGLRKRIPSAYKRSMIARLSPLPLALLATTLLSVVLAALGPFGTYLNGALPSRLLYWLATAWLGLALYAGVLLASRSWLKGASGFRWGMIAAGSLLASVPEAWLSRKLAFALWPMLGSHAPSFWTWYGQTALIGGAWTIGLARLLLRDRIASATSANVSSLTPVEPISPFSGEVLALQMEDHYIRVHRREGSQLVLMPLNQGIAALGRIDGLRTHRSWWVARAAVVEVQGTPRAMKLKLHNGLEAPVARSAVTSLRQAGWIR